MTAYLQGVDPAWRMGADASCYTPERAGRWLMLPHAGTLTLMQMDQFTLKAAGVEVRRNPADWAELTDVMQRVRAWRRPGGSTCLGGFRPARVACADDLPGDRPSRRRHATSIGLDQRSGGQGHFPIPELVSIRASGRSQGRRPPAGFCLPGSEAPLVFGFGGVQKYLGHSPEAARFRLMALPPPIAGGPAASMRNMGGLLDPRHASPAEQAAGLSYALAYARWLAGSGDAALCAAIGMTLPLVPVLEPGEPPEPTVTIPPSWRESVSDIHASAAWEPPGGVWINRLVATELTALMRADSEVSVSRSTTPSANGRHGV